MDLSRFKGYGYRDVEAGEEKEEEEEEDFGATAGAGGVGERVVSRKEQKLVFALSSGECPSCREDEKDGQLVRSQDNEY